MSGRACKAVNSGGPGGKRSWTRQAASALAGLCAIALALPAIDSAAGGPAARSGDICRDVLFAGVAHVVCEISPAQRRGGLHIGLHWKGGPEGDGGAPFGSLRAVEQELARQGRTPLVTMNAGMYEPDLSPVGLFVSDGRVQSPVNARAGAGNFYLKPNGVFFIAGRKAGVMETRAFARSRQKPDIATQSGPLMVLGGRIHPSFQADGESRKIRNGIGVRKDGTVVLAISRGGISFGQFARLFRDYLRCPDALYLDGSVSQLSRDGAAGREQAEGVVAMSRKPLGPILSVSAK